MRAADLTFAEHGAQLFSGLAVPLLDRLHSLADRLPSAKAGIRIVGDRDAADLLSSHGIFGQTASTLTADGMSPVRAVLFDKSDAANWSLGWHQDRTIAVQARHDHSGFGPWTVKQGIPHVQPPFELTRKMTTLRIHLDEVDDANGPLLIALGSHRLGLVPIDDIDHIVAQSQHFACLAQTGDVWAYSTPILHASNASSPGRRRRVLQVDFSADSLPEGLEWLGL